VIITAVVVLQVTLLTVVCDADLRNCDLRL
jgi:hypothetical protein